MKLKNYLNKTFNKYKSNKKRYHNFKDSYLKKYLDIKKKKLN